MLISYSCSLKAALLTVNFILLWIGAAPLLLCQPMLSGPKNAILSSSAVTLPINDWSGTNPASLAGIEHKHFSFFTSKGYGLTELGEAALNMAFPARGINVGFTVQSFGYKLYRELKITPTLAKTVTFGTSRPILIGFSGTINHLIIRNLGQQTDLAFSSGFVVEPWPRVHLGMSIIHWLGSSDSSSLEKAFRAGMSYQISETYWMLFAVEKTLSFPSSVTTGIIHYLIPQCTLYARISTEPYRFAVGMDLLLDHFNASFIAEKHMILNWTPALSFGLRF